MINKKIIRTIGVVLLILGLTIGGTPRFLFSQSETEKISLPFQYSGYTFPEYQSYSYRSEYAPMSDGTKLAAAIYLPASGPSTGPFPVILWYLPGHRRNINPATGQLFPPSGEVTFFTSYGYAFVIAEMRGSGASTGYRQDRSPQLGKDGKELVDWIAAQSWCDGNVGMVGASYQGFSQYATAGEKPAALKAIYPEVAGFDEYTGGLFYPGGIWNVAMTAFAPASIAQDDQNVYKPPKYPSAPVVDEDGDGELVDEIPIDKNGNGTFLDDGLPTYSDGKLRQDIYYNATVEHLNNVNLGPDVLPFAPYRDSKIGTLAYSYIDQGPSYRPITIAESGIALYNRGGWFDYHVRCTTNWFATLTETNPSKMLLTPATHGTGPYWSYFGLVYSSTEHYKEKLRFFDHYLKGIENGINKEPPIYIYVMNGNRWRFENEWPIGRKVDTKYYFAEGNTLIQDTTPTSPIGSDQYQVNYKVNSGSNRYALGLSYYINNVVKRTDIDPKCLTYTSEPLERDIEVTGHPIVNFWVSSTANDGDFFVYLEDIDEMGEAYYVTDGLLRANFAKLYDNNEDILPPGSTMNVLPDLPWHGFKESDYVDGIFASGKKVELVIDFMPTSWVFKKGHRIRVSIAGADWPTFQLHPKLSPANNPSDSKNIVPTVTVYRNASYPSSITLPVIPPKPTVFEGTAKVRIAKTTYEGPAKLYTFTTAVYLNYEDSWLKWDVFKTWEAGMVEQYRGEGELGRLLVLVVNNERLSFDALAIGNGVYFKGNTE